MRSILVLTIILWMIVAASCGGGGAESTSTQALPPTRHGMFFDYFFDCGSCQSQQYDHVTQVWINSSDPAAGDRIVSAHKQGLRVVLDAYSLLYSGTGECGSKFVGVTKANENAGAFIAATGALPDVLYPIDEPEYNVCDPNAVGIANAVLRQHFPGVPIEVIYGCGRGFIAVSAFDGISCDAYGSSVESQHQTIMRNVLPGQYYFLVPGGADPWRENPESYYSVCVQDARCKGLRTFIFTDYIDPHGVMQKGIGGNGMLSAYRSVGLRIKGAA